MIAGVGTDIVKISRVKSKLSVRILSDEEKVIYESFSSESRKQEYLAGRFAVKEALTKAFSSTKYFFSFTDMVILNDEEGRPHLIKPEINDLKVWLSISHEREYALAFCLLEDKSK